MEDFSFEKQAEIFSKAKVIIAPHGAALTNLIFSNKNIKLLELFPENFQVPCYWILASRLGIKHYSITGRVTDIETNNFEINISKLDEILNIIEEN